MQKGKKLCMQTEEIKTDNQKAVNTINPNIRSHDEFVRLSLVICTITQLLGCVRIYSNKRRLFV